MIRFEDTQEWCGQWSVKGSADIVNVRKNGAKRTGEKFDVDGRESK